MEGHVQASGGISGEHHGQVQSRRGVTFVWCDTGANVL